MVSSFTESVKLYIFGQLIRFLYGFLERRVAQLTLLSPMANHTTMSTGTVGGVNSLASSLVPDLLALSCHVHCYDCLGRCWEDYTNRSGTRAMAAFPKRSAVDPKRCMFMVFALSSTHLIQNSSLIIRISCVEQSQKVHLLESPGRGKRVSMGTLQDHVNTYFLLSAQRCGRLLFLFLFLLVILNYRKAL